MKNLSNLYTAAQQYSKNDTEAANTDVVITLPATEGETWIVDFIRWSYSAVPSSGQLVVKIGSETETYDITNGGFDETGNAPQYRNDGDEVVITLKAGGSGVVGRLKVAYR